MKNNQDVIPSLLRNRDKFDQFKRNMLNKQEEISDHEETDDVKEPIE